MSTLDSANSPSERIMARAAELVPGLVIHRALPTRQRRMVGAWCFLDHIGPVSFQPGQGMHVGAHPHTCLQTFTWMIRGEMLHRDSLGSEQVIRPGQVNLMTAGRGIVHTEDSLPNETLMHAAQLWIALPPGLAGCDPAFDHHPDLPSWDDNGCTFTLLAGSFNGREAPARVHSPLVGIDLCAMGAHTLCLPLNPDFEYGILPLEGSVRIGDAEFQSDEFAYLGQGRNSIAIGMTAGSRLLVLGGEPFPEPIVMWWNFVGFSKAEIATAQAEWENGGARFGRVRGDEGRRLAAPALPWPTVG